MKITTRMVQDELYEASNESGLAVSIDMRTPSERQHQNPVELLLSSLSACGAVDIVMMLKKRKKKIIRFEIVTDGTRREAPPRSFTHIHCSFKLESPDVAEHELQKVAALALEKYCSVAASLKAEITFSVEVKR